ncbi:MAG: hypothetical protein M1820_003923 [Bogoriella megaspora]|nr:MAG: hypothetical protein M1820_003923 [Bogoriella megaspora]
MPRAKPRPSEIAAEAKKTYIPYIERTMPGCSAVSTFHSRPGPIDSNPKFNQQSRLRIAVIDGDPVDVALDWYEYARREGSSESTAPKRIPVVNMANEKRPGGDWESAIMAPEECFARRSNLVHALSKAGSNGSPGQPEHYPLPQTGGLYSQVVVFRDGADYYQIWREFKELPVISVAPVRRPKLDRTNSDYSFDQERDLMLEKMRAVLRIASQHGHQDVCLGAFGVGSTFRNPARQVARMWKSLLFEDAEFGGAFANVVFAIQSKPPGDGQTSAAELEIFQEELSASSVFKTARA